MKQWRRLRNKADHEAKQKKAGARERAKRKDLEKSAAGGGDQPGATQKVEPSSPGRTDDQSPHDPPKRSS